MSAAELGERLAAARAAGGERLSYVDDSYLLVGPRSIVAETTAAVAPFVCRAETAGAADATLCAIPEPPPAELRARVEAEGERIVVDASLYPSASEGRRLDLGSQRLVLIEKTGSLCALAPGERLAGIFNGDPDRLAGDALRLLKSLVTLHCEARGMLVLHASGVVLDGRCFLFAGDSRNGKTTTLLGALDRFDVDMLSCDTSVVWAGPEGLSVRGWPSNFSVSIGTMLDFESLLDHLEPQMRRLGYAEAWDIHPKHVLETSAVAAGAGWRIEPQARLDGVVALSFAPGGEVGLEPLGGAALGEFLAGVTLGSRDALYPDWHGFWPRALPATEPPLDLGAAVAAGQVEAWSMRWAPAPETLLRRIPALDRVHRHTVACRERGG